MGGDSIPVRERGAKLPPNFRTGMPETSAGRDRSSAALSDVIAFSGVEEGYWVFPHWSFLVVL
jgi:hypothetical protein